MLAEMGDFTFGLGSLDVDNYRSLYQKLEVVTLVRDSRIG
jgi:hypothetical protein